MPSTNFENLGGARRIHLAACQDGQRIGNMATNMATRKTQKNQKNPKAAKVASRSRSWIRRRSAKCDWLADRRGQGGGTTRKGPGPVTRGKVVSWTPKTSVFVRVFLRSPRGSTGAASFKSNLPAQPDFFGNSPRPVE
jgi:hypothetical protein